MKLVHDSSTTPEQAAAVLRRIALLLERSGESLYRSQAFRRAAAAVVKLAPEEFARRALAGTLTEVPGIGTVTAGVLGEVARGERVSYLERLEAAVDVSAADDEPSDDTAGHASGAAGAPDNARVQALMRALRGDCHVHSDWSDGTASIREMAEGARELGHEYMVLTDHSPTLKIARGLTSERLREQLDVIEALNRELAPFRILTGIEVDILADGSLDQEDELLGRLDLVVGSLHSGLRTPEPAMTERMLRAIANPHLDVLGHCTGRLRTGRRQRPESTFDARRVFEACRDYDKAVEINSLPSRLDPPSRLLKLANDLECRFSIDSDAHAPGQLAWKRLGAERAITAEVPTARIVNTLDAEALREWTCRHDAPRTPRKVRA